MTLQTYTHQKTVKADKIHRIDHDKSTIWISEGKQYLVVSKHYMTKHSPEVGGYYVQREGYESFLPAEVFETGYTLEEVNDE